MGYPVVAIELPGRFYQIARHWRYCDDPPGGKLTALTRNLPFTPRA